jgi:hypothetical protein
MTLLLRETARKHTHAEKIKEGMSPQLVVRVAELLNRANRYCQRFGRSRSFIWSNRSGSRGQRSRCGRDCRDPGPGAQESAIHSWSSLEGIRSISGSVTSLLFLIISSFANRQYEYSRDYRGFTTLRPHAPSLCEYVIRSVVGHTIVRCLTISRSSFLWEVSRCVTCPS